MTNVLIDDNEQTWEPLSDADIELVTTKNNQFFFSF